MKREYTASVYLIEDEKILLIFHHKLQKWLPPGGHVEAYETPSEAARREVFEEVGFEIEFIPQENIWVEHENAKSIERPYLILLEDIPSYQDIPPHQHIDFVFLAKPLLQSVSGIYSFRWFSWNELQSLQIEHEIFKETVEIIHNILDFAKL